MIRRGKEIPSDTHDNVYISVYKNGERRKSQVLGQEEITSRCAGEGEEGY